MKTKLKSIIAAAIACVAVVSQAEGYKWRLDPSEYMTTPADEWYSGDAYVFAAGTQQDVLDAFFAGTDISTLSVEGSSLYIDQGETFEPFPLFQYGTVGQNNSAFFAAILTEGGKDYVFISEEASVMNPATGNGQYEFLSEEASAKVFESTTYSAAGYYTQAVPPPPPAALAVANVKTATHWPWDGKIDVTCDLTGMGKVQLSAALTTNGVKVCDATAANLTGATTINLDAAGGVTNGVKFVWDAKADCPAGFNSKDTKVRVSAKKFTPPPAGQLWEKGPIWAECNVGDGATVPGDYGALYTFDDNEAADAAASLGADWRLPTAEEFTNLLNNCEKNWETCKDSTGADRAGYRFTGKGDYSSNSIFLPAAGFSAGRERLYAESNGYYWSSKEKDPNNAWTLEINKDKASVVGEPCVRYMFVRAVRDAK